MSSPFTLSVPIDARYRLLAELVAGKYVALIGGTPADVEELSAAVARAVDKLSAGVPADASVDLAFRSEGGGVRVEMRCGTRSTEVSHVLAG